MRRAMHLAQIRDKTAAPAAGAPGTPGASTAAAGAGGVLASPKGTHVPSSSSRQARLALAVSVDIGTLGQPYTASLPPGFTAAGRSRSRTRPRTPIEPRRPAPPTPSSSSR